MTLYHFDKNDEHNRRDGAVLQGMLAGVMVLREFLKNLVVWKLSCTSMARSVQRQFQKNLGSFRRT